MGVLEPMHLVVILGIALLVFGPKKLPELGKGLGESIRGFKRAIADTDSDDGTRIRTDSVKVEIEKAEDRPS